MPGWYQIGLPDATLTNGAGTVGITLQGAANMVPVNIEIQLDAHAEVVKLVNRNAYLVESQRGAHTWQGNYFYVAPNTGDTHANGARGGKDDPYSSLQDCITNAITDSNHDVIFLVSDAAAGPTTLSEAITIPNTKRYTFIRGPGRDFIITRPTNGDTFTIEADGVELSGFQLETANSGVGKGIQASGADFVKVHNVWINDTRGDGIEFEDCNNGVIVNNTFQGSGQSGAGHGINITGNGGSSNNCIIRNNHLDSVQGDGIRLSNGTTNETDIQNNTIHESTGWAINIGASADGTTVANNVLADNASGGILDNGTNTVDFNNDNTPNLVWDELLTGSNHNIPNSAGRRLRQLASTVITSGTAQGPGANSNQIQLDAAESASAGAFDPSLIGIVAGTGINQFRNILQYDPVTKIAVVDRTWKTVPDATSEYVVYADAGREHVNEGLARGGTASTIILNALASTNDNEYNGQTIFIRSGTGEDQSRVVESYDGATQTATVSPENWNVVPDTTSGYVMLGVHTHTSAEIESIVKNMIVETKGSYTLQQALSIILSVCAGVTSNSGATLKTPDGTTTRIAATVDAGNNRTAMTITPSS
jgi:hypothetical protein